MRKENNDGALPKFEVSLIFFNSGIRFFYLMSDFVWCHIYYSGTKSTWRMPEQRARWRHLRKKNCQSQKDLINLQQN